jgi:hypothetical protein
MFQVDSYHDFDWYDDGNLQLDAGELDLYKTRDNLDAILNADPDFFFHKDLKPEKDMEILLGLEKEILSDFAVGVNLIYRKHYDLNWTVPYVWDGGYRLVQPGDWSDYSVTVDGKTYTYWDTYDADVYDEGIGQVRRRPDFNRIYKGLELTFDKRLANNWMLKGSFTFQDTTVNYESRDSFIDPTDHMPEDMLGGTSGPHSYAEFVMNARWMFKLSWLYRLPLGIHFSGNFVAREGYIFPRIATLEDEYKRWWDNEKPVVLLDTFGESRYPTFYQLDLRLEKRFSFKNLGRLILSLDAFNLTNSNKTLSKGNDTAISNYNVPLVILNPRVIRLGARYEF